MKIFSLLLAAALSAPGDFLSAHPPSVVAVEAGDPDCTCRIDPDFEPVRHTGHRQLTAIFTELAHANGLHPDDYTIELMRHRQGVKTINAMTCAHSRMIWISVTAWERLRSSRAAITLLLAHELAHGDPYRAGAIRAAAVTAAERRLLAGMTDRQLAEVAADQRSADLMARAGYSAADIFRAKYFILGQDASGNLSRATESHPTARDRANALTFYLWRSQGEAVVARK